MRKFAAAIRSFLTADDGATAVEYAVLLALIILVCFTAVMTLGSQTNSAFQKASSLP